MDTYRIAMTPGEPAGIGPDLVVALAQHRQTAEIVAIADPDLLQQRAHRLQLPLRLRQLDLSQPPAPHRPGELGILPVAMDRPATPGKLDPVNAAYVLKTLDIAIEACLHQDFAALVTGPLQKSVINDAGTAFSGHTEYLAERTGATRVVMLLATPGLRVALATTHLPLAQVAQAITRDNLRQVIDVLHHDLQFSFGLKNPHIAVCGLNPHAGEGGYLGREEIDIIEPVLTERRQQGMKLSGPLPADTLFTPPHLQDVDAVLAMYHDQGLPVLKYKGFGQAANITLGLPIIRTSVDHGTALNLAGSGQADAGSLITALACAQEMIVARNTHSNNALL